MPAAYSLLSDLGIAYVKFNGHVLMDEVLACLHEFSQEPDIQSIARHLIDFSGVTSFDKDVVKIVETQAKVLGTFGDKIDQWIFVYYAPTKVSRELAGYGIRAWNEVPKVVVRMTDTENAAMDIFGLRQRTLAELLEGVTPH